jgi:glycosyltransferase involved in cell wall biosynthesis
VVLPTRNRPRFLREALGSVLGQSLRPAEVVVVDDGDGGAAEVVRSVEGSGPRVRVLAGPGRGPAAARNLGVAAAQGDLIAFLDDDDLWRPEKLARQALWFERWPGLGALGSGCVRSESPAIGHCTRLGRARGPRRVSRVDLLHANRLVLSSVVVRRGCLDECGGFDESLPLGQDWDLWLRVSERWQVAALPEPLTGYRLHPEQRTRDQSAMRQWEAEVVRRAMARDPASALRGVARRRLSWAHCRLGRLLIRRGEIESAMPELRQALSLSPFHPVVWGSLARCAWAGRDVARQAHP